MQTTNVDAEMALIAGPQLVCPVDNARYILNATNARWGSLLDAIYGTDVLPETEGLEKGRKYVPARGGTHGSTVPLISPLETIVASSPLPPLSH